MWADEPNRSGLELYGSARDHSSGKDLFAAILDGSRDRSVGAGIKSALVFHLSNFQSRFEESYEVALSASIL